MITNNNEPLLFEAIWGNVFIRSKIFSFLNNKASSLLLSKYHGRKNKLYNNNRNTETQQLFNTPKIKEIKSYNYYEIKDVSKMAIYHKELLRDKVKKGDNSIIFQINPYDSIYTIFGRFQDNLTDKEFYLNLFKNYPIQFNVEKDFNLIIQKIIRMDCLVALLSLLEFTNTNNQSLFEFIQHYIYSIKCGSFKISNYLSENYGFGNQLTEIHLLEIIQELFSYNNLGTGYNYLESIKKLQIDEFGYELSGGVDSIKTGKTIQIIKYLSTIFGQQPSFSNYCTNIEISTVVECTIENKPLQFLVDSCFVISFLRNLVKLDKVFDLEELIANQFQVTNQIELVLSIDRLNEINKSLNEEGLMMVKVEDINTETDREDIKQLLKMVIAFSGYGLNHNISIYNAKFENKIEFMGPLDRLYFALRCGDYKKLIDNNNKCYKDTMVNSQLDKLFLYCKNDDKKQREFIQDFINDIHKSDDNEYNKLLVVDGNTIIDPLMTSIGFKHTIFHILLSYNNFELLEMIYNSIDKINKSFLNNMKYEFIFIKSPKVFDMFYNNKHFKQHFDFKLLLKYSQDSSIVDYKEFNRGVITNSILNHFKSNYPNDYLNCCLNDVSSLIKDGSIYLYDFVYRNIQDFKQQLLEVGTKNYWEHYFDLMFKSKPIAIGGFMSNQKSRNPLEKPLPLWKFIIIVEQLTPFYQEYCCQDSMEIMAWVFSNRKFDIDSGRCKLSIGGEHCGNSNLTILECYHFSNQLSITNSQSLFNSLTNEEKFNLVKKILTTNNELIKSVIKFNDIDEFEILFQFIKEQLSIIQQPPIDIREMGKMKGTLLNFIAKYNNIKALTFLNENDPCFFNDVDITNYLRLVIRMGCIEVINYLIDIMDIKFTFCQNIEKELYWRRK